MKALYKVCGDGYTYGYQEVIFCFDDTLMTSIKLINHIKSIYPEIKETDLVLLFEGEEINVIDDRGCEVPVFISTVDCLE